MPIYGWPVSHYSFLRYSTNLEIAVSLDRLNHVLVYIHWCTHFHPIVFAAPWGTASFCHYFSTEPKADITPCIISRRLWCASVKSVKSFSHNALLLVTMTGCCDGPQVVSAGESLHYIAIIGECWLGIWRFHVSLFIVYSDALTLVSPFGQFVSQWFLPFTVNNFTLNVSSNSIMHVTVSNSPLEWKKVLKILDNCTVVVSVILSWTWFRFLFVLIFFFVWCFWSFMITMLCWFEKYNYDAEINLIDSYSTDFFVFIFLNFNGLATGNRPDSGIQTDSVMMRFITVHIWIE